MNSGFVLKNEKITYIGINSIIAATNCSPNSSSKIKEAMNEARNDHSRFQFVVEAGIDLNNNVSAGILRLSRKIPERKMEIIGSQAVEKNTNALRERV